jgi:peptidyl-prolyl cis-trans isomerase B (cyclophilin B)
MKVRFTTSKGEMIAELFSDATPKTVANFRNLISEGFYDSMKFHRVIPNFMVQGGYPEGTGRGGSGTTIMCEHQVANFPSQQHDRGTLSMAHAGPNTGSSQFFICHNRQGTQHLDGVHTAFGKVIEGLDILDTIAAGDAFSISLI